MKTPRKQSIRLYGLQVTILQRKLDFKQVDKLLQMTDFKLATHYINFGFLPNQLWANN